MLDRVSAGHGPRARDSVPPVQVGDEVSIRHPRGFEFLVAFLKLAMQVNDLLFKASDPALELVDVVGGAKT